MLLVELHLEKIQCALFHSPLKRDVDYSSLIELCPDGYSFITQPRLSGRGGGLAVAFQDRFSCRSVKTGFFRSFELQLLKIDDTLAQWVDTLAQWVDPLCMWQRLYEFSNEARMASLGTEAMNLALSVPGSSHLEATIESQ
ncbi:voltage-dependent calcium channel gamma-1 [Sarotherodon galilaeus]